MSERIPLPIPFGWYRVAESIDLAVGDVKNIHYVGQDFVLFRDEEGVAQIVEPHCPHLGAHLGYGGKVVGCAIKCPFHGWQFNGEGECVDVPYAKNIPKKAKLKSFLCDEKNGVIFMWYHPHDEAPTWTVPVIEEWCAEGWLEPMSFTDLIKSHPQEMAENVVDSPHFHFVHGTPDIPEKDFSFEGHILKAFQALTFTTPDGEVKGRVDIESHGGSIGITRFEGVVDTLIFVTGTPVDDETNETVMRFSVKLIDGDVESTRGVAEAFVKEVKRQHLQDVPIWENKIYRENPVLCDGDGPIHKVRKYYKQFYADPLPETIDVKEVS